MMTRPATYSGGMYPLIGQPAYPELWQGCVGRYTPSLGPTGLSLFDWSGFKQHGTLTGMDTGTDWIFNNGVSALDFDGTNDFVSVTDTTKFRVQSYTIECFITSRTNTGSYFFFKQNSRPTTFVESFSLFNNTGVFGAAMSSSGGTQTAITVARNLNQRYHVAATFSQPTLRLFLNGVQVASGSHNFSVDHSANPLSFGSGFSLPCNCIMESASIFDRVIPDSSIRMLSVRPGIAHEVAPRRVSRIFTGGFKAYWAARKAQIIGGGV